MIVFKKNIDTRPVARNKNFEKILCFRSPFELSCLDMLSSLGKNLGNLSRQPRLQTFCTSRQKCQSLGSHLWSLKSGPAPALSLGAAGLIPFVSAPAYMFQMNEFVPILAEGQLAYGAVILSFLGGVRWGKLVTPGSLIKPSWSQFTWSVTPSLIAWPALILQYQQLTYSLPISSLTLVAGLGLCGYLDVKQTGYVSWFKGLRIVLTTVAIMSLLSTLILSYILTPSDNADSS